MGTTNLTALIESALRQLEQDGATEKTISGYRTTGFGEIRRQCADLGQGDFSAEFSDTLVAELRYKYEQGLISLWKWRYVRRGCEILKHLSDTGTIQLPPRSRACSH